MSETEIYILESIRKWVWSGYYQPDHVREMLYDILEEDVDGNVMHQAIDIEFARKAEEEKSWPPVTDCDRVIALKRHILSRTPNQPEADMPLKLTHRESCSQSATYATIL